MKPRTRIDLREGHIVVAPVEDADLRVFLFPHAGGSAMSLLPLASELPAGTEALLFELPGRGARAREPRPATFDEACQGLVDHVQPLLDRPAILFGHSLGGLLCDGLVRRLPPEQRKWLTKVIVSSAPSPLRATAAACETGWPPTRRSRADLLARLIAHGGTPAEVFDDEALLEGVLEAFGDDMLLMDSYVLDPALSVCHADYELWTGRHDGSAAADLPEAWADVLARPLGERVFPGGHFYLTDRPEARAALRAIVRAQLRRDSSAQGQEAVE